MKKEEKKTGRRLTAYGRAMNKARMVADTLTESQADAMACVVLTDLADALGERDEKREKKLTGQEIIMCLHKTAMYHAARVERGGA